MKDLKQTEIFRQSSQGDSLAKTSQLQEKEKASKQNAQGCGQRCFDSSEMYGQRGQLLKMYQPCDLKDLPWSYKISARSGICVNGIAYPLVPLVLLTRETGFGLWHTPLASAQGPAYEKRYPGGKTRKHPIPNLAAEVKEGIPYSVSSAMRKDPTIKWPTPCANTRPNEGNVRILRNKVIAGEMTREEARAMLNGKDPFESQGAVPAMKWPTPTASDVEGGTAQDVQMENGSFFRENKKGVRWGVKLRDAAHHTENQLKDSPNSGQLNPTWVEWLMGYPIGWTDLSNSETQ